MYEFDTASNRQVRKEARKRAEYADSQLEPGLRSLTNQVRGLFFERVSYIKDDISLEEIERIWGQCVEQVPGSQEVFEIWDKLFDEAEVN